VPKHLKLSVPAEPKSNFQPSGAIKAAICIHFAFKADTHILSHAIITAHKCAK